MAEALTEYLNDQDKIKQLVESFITKRDEQQEQINPACPEEIGEKIILANGFLPIDEMEIGQIPQQYQTQAELPLEIDLRKKILYPKVAYLHSGVETLERSDILEDLRKGEYDVVVGINLLREGLDLPEVTLVAILDADKEGFLRSRISMIQTMGRAARHIEGRAILYADNLTKSMKLAIEETQRRREYQLEYNRKHNIDPKTIIKPIRDRMIEKEVEAERTKGEEMFLVDLEKEQVDLVAVKADNLTPDDKRKMVKKLRTRMRLAADQMDFELAAVLRDKVGELG
ncbi:UvrB/UvrC motif-containing protein [Patescibacteria group bacterium]|nr:UvrB/UvrC motif-containing protein [Patescibacteria group bacterium]MBU1885667.1 UvrB/UvrC motif-containing protein [Patescibacteria group bacterium]